MSIHHTPVLLDECLNFLITKPSGVYFDGTLGFGGHSQGILSKLDEHGKLVATDFDFDAFSYSKEKFADKKSASIYNFNFSLIDVIAKIESLDFFDGILADLGVSSYQLDTPASGFSYRINSKLDLRMDKSRSLTAAEVINDFSEEQIADIIYRFGEEKKSRRIAKNIVEKRKISSIRTTCELNEIISELVPPNFRNKTLSRVFQALRIYVNDEMENLKLFLSNSLKVMSKGSRIAIISYHSLEDRIVKEFFREQAAEFVNPKLDPAGIMKKQTELKIITKKPVMPTEAEIENNYRSRSAKLRVAEKI